MQGGMRLSQTVNADGYVQGNFLVNQSYYGPVLVRKYTAGFAHANCPRLDNDNETQVIMF